MTGQEASINGEFASVPEVGTAPPDWTEGTFLGSGVWFGNDRTGAGMIYVENGQEDVYAVDITVFQASAGDTNGNGDVGFEDFNDLANNYTGTGGSGKDWLRGDFDGDEDVDFGDFNDLCNHYTGAGNWYDGGWYPGDGGERGGDGDDAAREDGDGDGGGYLLDGAGEAELWVDVSDGSVSLYGDDVGLNGISVASASGSLEPNDPPWPWFPPCYPFYNPFIYTESQIDAGNIGKVQFDEGGEEIPVFWTFDTEGTQDLVFFYGTSEGTFQGSVVYYEQRDSGSGGSAPELAAASVPDWVHELDPQVLADLARFVAERESSANTPGATAADQLAELLLMSNSV